RSGPWVRSLMGPTDVVLCNVGVNFGGCYARVTEHRLDAPQIGPIREQVCGERVAELVRRQRLGDAHASRVAEGELPHPLPGEGSAAGRDEERALAGTGRRGAPSLQVSVEVLERNFADGDEAALVPLAEGGNDAAAAVDIAHLEATDLADAKPRGVHEAQ